MTDKSNPAIDALSIEPRVGSSYPVPFDTDCMRREKRAMGNSFGLTQFGVNLVRLPPGQWSSQRHWHHGEDELVYILEGRPTLVTDAGKQLLAPGMTAGFKAGVPNGHHLVNESGSDVLYIEIGSRLASEEAEYSDIDMRVRVADGMASFFHKDGRPYRK